MPIVPTRFIHASNLRLDHQPQGVGAVSRESQINLEDCTLTTFEEIIKACLEYEINFLLLTGNTFIDEDYSIRARIALIDGFQQLASKDIQVFIIPGQHDPLTAWDLQSNWPDNVTFLSPQNYDRLDIIHEDDTVATLQILDAAHYKLHQPLKLKKRNQLFNQHNQRVFSIGCITASPTADQSTETKHTVSTSSLEETNKVPVDYLALCKGTQRHTFEMQPGIAHHPGAAQGLNFDEYKSNGVTLVTINPGEPLDHRSLNVAVVRWLVIDLKLNSETSRNQLKQLMEEALLSLTPAGHEKQWMVRWKIKGAGELFETLRSFKNQGELSTELAIKLKDRLPVLLEQSFYLQEMDAHSIKKQSDLIQLYQQQLEDFQKEAESPLNQLLSQTAHLDQTWQQRLNALTEQVNEQHIFNTAIQNGHNWLSISTGEEVHT
jgi:DNA repair protein SbcD/Mre11